ncbi:MAG: 16S rRNA (cytosine(967)-C(5))-methyltransferase RsmB [Thermodesulfobacteriota bacterium]
MINPDPAKIPSARALALDILAGAKSRGQTVEDLLAGALKKYPSLSRADRGLLLELVQGVKRWEIRLDYVIAHLSHLPLKKLHPLVLLILRIAAYQILFLDRVPNRAAVAEAGRLAKERRLPKAHAGFINAVLRKMAAGERPSLPDPKADPVPALSVATAHPAWLVERWLSRYGLEATPAKLTANNQVPPLFIRVNTLKTDPVRLQARLAAEGVTATPCRFSPGGLQLISFITPPQDLPSFREGRWLFQDEAAQLVSLLLPVAPGQKILEIGAGRGGKTTHLAEKLQNQGLLLALDYHRPRLKELRRNLRRWGATVAQPLRADATQPLPIKKGSLDAVLLDVPCSALGIIRRHPEIKTRLQESDLATFPPRQLAMLEQAAALLRPGGRLLYITCTTEPEENQELIAAFLQNHPEFHLTYEPELLPPPARPFLQPPGFFQSSPEPHQLDGFFAAALVRG